MSADPQTQAELIDAYPLSPLQQGMLFHSLYAPHDGVYVEQRWCTLDGALDVDAFQRAWQQVVMRHSVLRSEFHWQDMEQPLQAVYDLAMLPWHVDDWRGLDAAVQQRRLADFLSEDRRQGFVLDRAPLMRCALLRVDEGRYRFVWSYHHLLMDGWCNGILIGEVLAHYDAARRQRELRMSPPADYRRYIDWLQQRDREGDDRYWSTVLAGIDTPARLDVGPPAAAAEVDYAVQDMVLDEVLSTALQAFARSHGLTLNTLFQGAVAVLLGRYGDSDDVLFGATVSGRPPELEGADSLLGLFINTVPVRVDVDPQQALLASLQALQQAQREREQHGFAPLNELQAHTGVTPGTRLFDLLLVFENYPVSIDDALGRLDVDLQLTDADGYERTNFPLTLVVIPGTTITLSARFETQSIDQSAAVRLCRHIETLLRGMIARPQQRLGDLPSIADGELSELRRWETGPRRALATATVADHVRDWAQREPSRAALTARHVDRADWVTLSYADIDRASAQIARALVARGVQHGDRIGVLLERTTLLPLALLAVFRAGAAYVPLARDYPHDRLRYVADDAGLKLVLHSGDGDFVHDCFGAGVDHVDLDTLSGQAGGEAAQPDDMALPNIAPQDLAYIIYTSGSTGRPKGVPISHANLGNFLKAMADAPGIDAGDVLLAVTTIAFDIAGLELFLPLCNGARVVLAGSDDARDADALAALMERHAVSLMQASPATWRLLLANDWPGRDGLRMLCGGEALDVALAAALLPRGAALWNLYGPTETTIWSAALRIDDNMIVGGAIPVGGPIDNTRLTVVDRHLRPVPIGIVGELLIGGAGLSPGYWRRPALTAERFVPAADDDGGRGDQDAVLYRTGDLVRRRDDGLLHFVGRSDFQVKLRGHRIELGEIEAALQDLPDIDQAVVTLLPDASGEPQLVAFVVGASVPDDRQLRDALRARLPDYMLPARFQRIDRLPLTLNGKVDRNALAGLAGPDEHAGGAGTARAVQTARVQVVADAWCELLGQKAVRGDDHFFEFGGHSLIATRLVTRLRALLGVDVPLRLVFEHPRFDDFLAAMETLQGGGAALPAIEPLPRDGGLLPVSPAQRRQWLLAGLVPDNPMYGIPTAVRVRGDLSVEALRAGLERLVARHENLRTGFVEHDGEPAARAFALSGVPIDEVTLPAADAGIAGDQLAAWLRADAQRPIEIGQAPLWRVSLVDPGDGDRVLVFTVHHILADGWSMGVLVRELASLYAAFPDGAHLPDLPVQYADYAAWVADLDHADDLAYWRRQLADLPPRLDLPTDFAYPAEPSSAGETLCFAIDAELRDALLGLGRREGSTLFMTLLSAFAVLLQRISGSDDIAIGTPVANRTHPDVEHLIGLFVNTLVLRLDLSGDPAVETLLARTRDTALAAFQHQQVPFEQVLDALDVPRNRSHAPLFQVLFTLQNAPFEATEVAGLSWLPLTVDSATAKFDLSLSLSESADGLDAAIEYRSDLFGAATIERFSRLYVTLLRALPDAVEQRLSTLPLLDAPMRAQLDTWRSAPVDRAAPMEAVHALFAQQAEATPDAVALVQGDETLSYRALEERANRVAHLLQECGVGDERAVGVWTLRATDTLCALLAILKAGATYVPLDPQMPAARLQGLIDDAGIGLVVGAGAGLPGVTADLSGSDCLWLDDCAERLAALPATAPVVEVPADRLAYILFTSGSTGRPKGVCTPHRGITRLVRQSAFARFGSDEVFLLSAPLGFDASTLEIWGPLLNGGRLVLPAADESGPLSLETLAGLVEAHAVTTLWLTAGLFHLMVDSMPQRLRSVRQLLAGGDVLSVDHLRRAHDALPSTQLINGYGPTEGTTFTCCHAFSDEELRADSGLGNAPIGRAIAYTSVHVLDTALQPVPVGVPGELYIGGQGLARGYLGDPALTAERFVPNPFFDPRRDRLDDAALTLYRSGDRVRWHSDGTLEFLGRLDEQVKIRGFRIEPGEIEHALHAHPTVAEAVVTALGDSATERRLAAFLVAEDGADAMPSAADLRRFLLERVPAQLVPSAFCWLDALPLNNNGKVDHSALPAPDWGRDTASSDVAAVGEIEQGLLAIWSSLLPAGQLDRHSNFFDAGGDSIIALQIVSQAARRGITITPMQLFQYQSVAELAAVAGTAAGSTRHGDDSPPEGDALLTPVQHWFFDQAAVNPAHFNQAVAIRLPTDIDAQRLATALQRVVAHHDAFRLRFTRDEDGNWQQSFAEGRAGVALQRVDLADRDAVGLQAAVDDAALALHTGLDLAQGPLLRAALIDRGATAGRLLLLVAHHLIVDGVSWRILLDDLHQAYLQPAAPAAPKTASWAAWGRALNGALPAADAELAYWQAQVGRAHCTLPLDGADKAAAAGRLCAHRAVLDEAATRSLLQDVPRRAGHEPHRLVLAAVLETLTDWSDGRVPTIDIEGHGRDIAALGGEIDVSHTIGWFTAIHPFTASFEPRAPAEARLTAIGQSLDDVPGQGIGYGLLRYLGGHDELAVQPAVGFNYLGQLDAGALPAGRFEREPVPGPLQSADMPRAHLIDINAWVDRQQLTVEWLYDRDVHDAATIERLAAQQLEGLRDSIGGLTQLNDVTDAGDAFALAGLDGEGLSAVLSQVSFGNDE